MQVPASSAFTVETDSSANLASTAPVIAGPQVTLALSTPITAASQVTTVAYTAPGSNPLQDLASNDAKACVLALLEEAI